MCWKAVLLVDDYATTIVYCNLFQVLRTNILHSKCRIYIQSILHVCVIIPKLHECSCMFDFLVKKQVKLRTNMIQSLCVLQGIKAHDYKEGQQIEMSAFIHRAFVANRSTF